MLMHTRGGGVGLVSLKNLKTKIQIENSKSLKIQISPENLQNLIKKHHKISF